MSYLVSECLQAPFSLGHGEEDRSKIVFNVDIQRTPINTNTNALHDVDEFALLLSDLRTLLINDFPGIKIYSSLLPDKQSDDPVVALFEYQGPKNLHSIGSGLPLVEMNRVQVVVRSGKSSNYGDARKLSEKLYRWFNLELV